MSRSIKINPEKTALFICDLQERFRSAIFGFEAITKSSKKLVDVAKALSIPVYITEQNPKALGATIHELGLADIEAACNPLGGPIPKTLFSMMTSQVTESIKEKGIKDVIICGIESHVCCLQTTLDLLNQGIQVHVIADAVSSCNPHEVPIALHRMRQSGAAVTTSESIIFQLLVDASQPKFKTVSGIIKQEKHSTKETLDALPWLKPSALL